MPQIRVHRNDEQDGVSKGRCRCINSQKSRSPSIMPLPIHRQTPSGFSHAPSLESIPQPLPSHKVSPHAFFDLVIIGAGPAALAVVARILETRPAALYTEQEHHFLHWLNKSQRGPRQADAHSAGRSQHDLRLIRTKASGRGAERVIAGEKTRTFHGRDSDSTHAARQGSPCPCPGEMRILVIDKVGQGWMAHWNNMFKALEIQHLRSPLFFHPCPADLDSLLAYAHRHGRNTVGDAKYASPICSHMKNGPSGRGRGGRGRDTKVKRLGCCADLDSDVEQPTSNLARGADLIEIPGVVGAEKSKHKKCKQRKHPHKFGKLTGDSGGAVNERERKDYFTPSTKLFKDFVEEDVVKRYGLSTQGNWPEAASFLQRPSHTEAPTTPTSTSSSPALTLKGEVCSMHWANLNVEDEDPVQGFYLKTTDGACIGAKAVVSATGPAGKPSFPAALQTGAKSIAEQPLRPNQSVHPPGSHLHGPGWCHSAALALPNVQFPPSWTGRERSEKTLVVVGGGLTSAQVCDTALRKGFDKVKLLLRGHMKVKPFDIGLDWMGRYSNLRKMQFWQEEDPAARLQMWREARQGGSMTQPYAKLMKQYQDAGRLEICTHTELEEVQWKEASNSWDVWVRRTCPVGPKEEARESYLAARKPASEEDEVEEEDVNAEPKTKKRHADFSADYIVTATAFQPDFAALPWIREVAQQYPLRQEGGLPLLTEHLQYGQLPLFAVGMYAGLQIGPAAGNLGGIREGADRVVSQLQTLIQPPGTSDGADQSSSEGGVDGLAEMDGDDTVDDDQAPHIDDDTRIRGARHHLAHREFGHLGFGALALEG